ncbi:MAG: hypothetical protein HUJ31_05575, partial [Pseudomonadales bacterium]|nr:hypothetical protein [Pseudomonadales bacterium]
MDTTSFFTRSAASLPNGIVEFSGASANINLPGGYYLDGVPWVLSAGVNITGDYFEVGSTGELHHTDGLAVVNTKGFANSGTLTVAPDLSFGGPLLHVHGDMDNYGQINLDNAVISSTGTETATLEVFGGTLFNYGTISSLDTELSGGTRVLMGNVDNYGTIDVQYSLTIDPDGGKFYNADFATITVGGGQTLTFGGINGGEVFNYGTIDATAGTNDTLDASTVYFQNEGAIQGFLNVFGLDQNNGVLSPGSSPGVMNIHGDYNDTVGSTLEIELEGYQPGTGYDQVIVHGSANINGRLNVTLLNGFTPALASGFAILLADSLTWSFAQAIGLDISTSQVLDLSYV